MKVMAPSSSGLGPARSANWIDSGRLNVCQLAVGERFLARTPVLAAPRTPQTQSPPSDESAIPINGPIFNCAAEQITVVCGCAGFAAENSTILSGNKRMTQPCRTGKNCETSRACKEVESDWLTMSASGCCTQTPFLNSSNWSTDSAQSCPPGLSETLLIDLNGIEKLLTEYPSSLHASEELKLTPMRLPCGVRKSE